MTQYFHSWVIDPGEIKESPHKVLHVHSQSSVSYSSPKWEQFQCPSTDKQINRMWTVSAVE